MRRAQLAALGIAVPAGLIAVWMGMRGKPPPPPPPSAPVVQIKTDDILVAGTSIGVGQKILATDLQWKSWPVEAISAAFIRKNRSPKAIEELAGSIARYPADAGEPIRESRLIKARGSGYLAAILPSGMRAVSTAISPETGAGGFILPNDHVDVILSRKDREAERATGVETSVAEVVLANVRVLAIDQTVQEKDGQRVVVGRTATLALSPRQVETLGVARQMGTLSLALRSLADSGKGPGKSSDDAADENEKSARTRLNMVRFGVQSTAMPR